MRKLVAAIVLVLAFATCLAASAEESPLDSAEAWLRNAVWVYSPADGLRVLPARFGVVSFGNSLFAEGLAPVYDRVEGKCGYIDQSLTLKIPAVYDAASPFFEGRATVEFFKNGDWGEPGLGVIDTDGHIIVAPGLFDDIGEFCDGYAKVSKNNWFGFIDRQGEVVIPLNYLDARIPEGGSRFSEGMAPLRTSWGQYIFVSPHREPLKVSCSVLSGFHDGRALVRDGEQSWFIDTEGKKLLGPFFSACRFSQQRALVETEKGKHQIIDPDGRVFYRNDKLKLTGSCNEMVFRHGWLTLEHGIFDNKTLMVDRQGGTREIDTGLTYVIARDIIYSMRLGIGSKILNNDLAVQLKGLYVCGMQSSSCYNTGTQAVFLTTDRNLLTVSECIANQFTGENRTGALRLDVEAGTVLAESRPGIDRGGIWAQPSNYVSALGSVVWQAYPRAEVRQDLLVKPATEGMVPAGAKISSTPEGRAVFSLHGKPEEVVWGYRNADAKVLIPPAFAYAGQFRNGLAVCSVHETVGEENLPKYAEGGICRDPFVVINKSGAVVFSSVKPILPGLDGTFMMRDEAGVFFVDASGKPLAAPEHRLPDARPRASGLFFAKDGDAVRFQLRRVSGELVRDSICDDARVFSDGLCAVRVGDLWGYCDQTGEVVIPPQFVSAYEFEEGYARVVILSQGLPVADLINRSGKRMIGKDIANWIRYGKLQWYLDAPGFCEPTPLQQSLFRFERDDRKAEEEAELEEEE